MCGCPITKLIASLLRSERFKGIEDHFIYGDPPPFLQNLFFPFLCPTFFLLLSAWEFVYGFWFYFIVLVLFFKFPQIDSSVYFHLDCLLTILCPSLSGIL